MEYQCVVSSYTTLSGRIDGQRMIIYFGMTEIVLGRRAGDLNELVLNVEE